MSTAESPAPLKRTSTIVTIVATVLGTVIAYLSLAAAVKWPPFQGDDTRVAVFRGDDPNDRRCQGTSCAFIGVELSGFEAGSTVRCTFDSAGAGPGSFGPYVATVDEDGRHRGQSTNFYGTPAGWVSATCSTDAVTATGARNPWGDDGQ
ncbi:hypothetical protein [Catellatospora sp. NPDC049609]|uniref:hypothetical protein n=1 Tax=Catellatospora sp. NPDC049609 TaxID=3155505 RepID=UPI00342C9590